MPNPSERSPESLDVGTVRRTVNGFGRRPGDTVVNLIQDSRVVVLNGFGDCVGGLKADLSAFFRPLSQSSKIVELLGGVGEIRSGNAQR